MKVPKQIRRHCPFCKKHTEHKVEQGKRRSPSSLSYGSKFRARNRGQARGMGSRGRYSKPAISKFKQTGKKSSKKTDLRYRCTECKKVHTQKEGFRSKRLEFI